MKTILLLGATALFLISCKKDYTCVCYANSYKVSTNTITDTKSKAKEECNDGDGTSEVSGFGTVTVDCEIQ